MASALYSRRTGGQSKGWFFITFSNYVEAVDLSPHNFSAKKRRGSILPVGNEALVVLRKLPRLRSLDLRDTLINDEGLQYIKSLNQLEQLDVRGTRITARGCEQLRIALPNCDIRW